VNHGAYSVLMNPKGQFTCVLAYELTPEQTAAKIQAAMKLGDSATSCTADIERKSRIDP
jgi:hypothetical protein